MVERPVGEAHKAILVRAAAGQQRLTHRGRVKAPRRLHRGRVTPGNLLVADGGVKIVGNVRLQPLEVGIDQKPVAAGLHSRERHRE